MVNGGVGKPTFCRRARSSGVSRGPTLVQNAETLAHVALIGRFGAQWFRTLGTDQGRGDNLVTLSVRRSTRRVRNPRRLADRAPLAAWVARSRKPAPCSSVVTSGSGCLLMSRTAVT